MTPGSTTVDAGGSVTLVATANPGYRFTGYTGSAPCTGTEPQLVVSGVAENVACTANFVRTLRVTYKIDGYDWHFSTTASVAPTGAACAGGVCNVDAGQSVTISAMVLPGYTATGWARWECTESATGAHLNTESTPVPENVFINSIQNDWSCVGIPYIIVF